MAERAALTIALGLLVYVDRTLVARPRYLPAGAGSRPAFPREGRRRAEGASPQGVAQCATRIHSRRPRLPLGASTHEQREPSPRLSRREPPPSRIVSKGMSANRESVAAERFRWMAVLVALGLATTAALTAVNCAGNDRAGTGSPTVRLRPVDGGVDYYAKFSHPLPSDPSYFPIGRMARQRHVAIRCREGQGRGRELIRGRGGP